MLVQPRNPVSHVAHLRHGIDASWHGKAHELHRAVRRLSVFPRLIYAAAFHASRTARDIYGARKAPRRILFIRYMRHKLHRIYMASESARRRDNRHAALLKLAAKESNHLRTLGYYVLVHRVVKTNTDGFHFTHAHSSVRRETFESRYERLQALVYLRIVETYAAAARKSKLSRRKVDYVDCVGQLAGNLSYRCVLIRFLARFYEVEVILQKARVEHGQSTVFLANAHRRKHIVERYRLAAYQVCSRLNSHERHSPALRLHETFELFKIEIALERHIALELEPFVAQHYAERSAALLYLVDSRAEEKVHRNNVALFDEPASKHVFARPALMHRQEIVFIEYLLYFCA